MRCRLIGWTSFSTRGEWWTRKCAVGEVVEELDTLLILPETGESATNCLRLHMLTRRSAQEPCIIAVLIFLLQKVSGCVSRSECRGTQLLSREWTTRACEWSQFPNAFSFSTQALTVLHNIQFCDIFIHSNLSDWFWKWCHNFHSLDLTFSLIRFRNDTLFPIYLIYFVWFDIS